MSEKFSETGEKEKGRTGGEIYGKQEVDMNVKIYTDGAARGNPDGPGGYGAVVQYVDGREELRRFGQTEHRMYYEFMEFIRMIEKGDWETHQKLLELSCAAAKLMTETRQKEGIWFPADRQ